jgi:hypothetical protein
VAQFSRTRWPVATAAAEAAALPDGAPGSEESAVPGDGTDLADGLEPAERPNGATTGGAASGAGMIELAPAEFARELSESLGAGHRGPCGGWRRGRRGSGQWRARLTAVRSRAGPGSPVDRPRAGREPGQDRRPRAQRAGATRSSRRRPGSAALVALVAWVAQ